MSWLPDGEEVIDEPEIMAYFMGVDPSDIQVRVAIRKGRKKPLPPVVSSVIITALQLLVANGKIGLVGVGEYFDRGDVFDFLGITPRELHAYVAEGKLHRVTDGTKDNIYFREELIKLRQERLKEVASVTNLRVLSTYASRALETYGGDAVAFSRDVFEWVVLPADGSVVNMPLLRRNMEYYEERYGKSQVEITTPRGEVPMSPLLRECLWHVLWSVLRNGMIKVAGVPRFVALFDARVLSSILEENVVKLAACGDVKTKWVDGKLRYDRDDLIAFALREHQRWLDIARERRQVDAEQTAENPEIWCVDLAIDEET